MTSWSKNVGDLELGLEIDSPDKVCMESDHNGK